MYDIHHMYVRIEKRRGTGKKSEKVYYVLRSRYLHHTVHIICIAVVKAYSYIFGPPDDSSVVTV